MLFSTTNLGTALFVMSHFAFSCFRGKQLRVKFMRHPSFQSNVCPQEIYWVFKKNKANKTYYKKYNGLAVKTAFAEDNKTKDGKYAFYVHKI